MKKKKRLKCEEIKAICNILWSYGFSMREIGYKICRQRYYSEETSRLTSMFLCEKAEEAKCYFYAVPSKRYSTLFISAKSSPMPFQ